LFPNLKDAFAASEQSSGLPRARKQPSPPKGLLELWVLASVAGVFEPKACYGARVRTGELSSIESIYSQALVAGLCTSKRYTHRKGSSSGQVQVRIAFVGRSYTRHLPNLIVSEVGGAMLFAFAIRDFLSPVIDNLLVAAFLVEKTACSAASSFEGSGQPRANALRSDRASPDPRRRATCDQTRDLEQSESNRSMVTKTQVCPFLNLNSLAFNDEAVE
jgi:hypothetical protein